MEEKEEREKQIDELLKERDRRKWLADLLKRGAQWIVAVSLGASVAWEWLGKLVKHFSDR